MSAHTLRSIAMTLLLGPLVGCATITLGTSQEVMITSDPPGAQVLVLPGDVEEITPAEVELDKNNAYTILLRQPDFEPDRKYIDREYNTAAGAATFGNLLLGGLIGLMIDAGSGAMVQLVPTEVHFDLERLPEVAASPPDADEAADAEGGASESVEATPAPDTPTEPAVEAATSE